MTIGDDDYEQETQVVQQRLKAKVALAALKGDQTTSELAARFEIHPTMVSQWTRVLLRSVDVGLIVS